MAKMKANDWELQRSVRLKGKFVFKFAVFYYEYIALNDSWEKPQQGLSGKMRNILSSLDDMNKSCFLDPLHDPELATSRRHLFAWNGHKTGERDLTWQKVQIVTIH